MVSRTDESGHGAVSALWNLSYDLGYGVGPAVFGMIVASTGYPWALALTGMVVLSAVLPAVRDRAAGRPLPVVAHVETIAVT
jgi:predicted MFS family arabinose efflux permease